MVPRLLYLSALLAAAQPVAAGQSCSDDITISNQADAERYSDCRDIRGTLRIDAAASGTIHLDNVEAIRGDFAVQGTQSLDSLDLPRLETVRGDVTAKDNANLNQLGMAGLRRLGGDLTIVDNSALLDLSLAALESVGGGLHLKGGFNTLSFDDLKFVRKISDIVTTGSAACSAIESLLNRGDTIFQSSLICSTPSATSSSALIEDSSDLSGGAIAGIVIGLIVSALIALLLLWLYFRRRNQKQTQQLSFSTIAAARPIGPGGDEEKQHESKERKSSCSFTISPDSSAAAAAAAGPGTLPIQGTKTIIPRKCVSKSSITTRTSILLPASLTPGTTSGANTNTEDKAASPFLGDIPASGRPSRGPRRLSESDMPMLDSADVHEAPSGAPGTAATQRQRETGVFELDAGAVPAVHQRVINSDCASYSPLFCPGDGRT